MTVLTEQILSQAVSDRQSLLEQQQALLAMMDIPILKREQERLVRSLSEGWGDYVDPLEWMNDDQSFSQGTRGSYISQRSDRKNGANRPIFETEFELAAIRGAARMLCDVMPTGICATENLLSYVVGPGFSCKAAGRKGTDEDLIDKVQAVVDEFLKSIKWTSEREEEAYKRLIRDGEVFIALFPRPDGITARFIEPEQISEPTATREIEEYLDWDEPSSWSFGIHSRDGSPEEVWGYYVQWSDSPADWDYIPAARMIHVKRNVDSAIKRGISDFYSVQSHLTNVGKLERNVAIGAAVLSAIIGICEHPTGTTRDQAQSFISSSAYRTFTRTTPAGSKQVNQIKQEPGTLLHMKAGQKFVQSPLASQGVGQAVVVIEQALLRTVGSRWCMPEYMISGDASNANYASTLVAESPFVKFCERQQGKISAFFGELLWKYLRLAVEAGRFAGTTFDELTAAVSLLITGPLVASRDKKVETDRNKVLNESGVISDQTWAEREGIDYEVEQERGAKRLSIGSMPLGVGLPQGSGAPVQPTGESFDRLHQAACLLWKGYPG